MAAVPRRASLFPGAKLRRRLEPPRKESTLKLPLFYRYLLSLLIVAIGSARMDVGRI